MTENPVPAPRAQGAGSSRFARLIGQLFIAAVLALLVRGLVVQSFYVPSQSMEPTVDPSDRVLVDKWNGSEGLRRGDIVVFDGTVVFGGPSTATPMDDGILGTIFGTAGKAVGIDLGEKDYLKRIVGLPGDHIVCCTDGGRLTINGVEIVEPYLVAGMPASTLTFDVTVPPGKIWVMGDNRPKSSDSRAHLGDPGGGMVPLTDIVGRVTYRYWPGARLGAVERSTELAVIPRGERP